MRKVLDVLKDIISENKVSLIVLVVVIVLLLFVRKVQAEESYPSPPNATYENEFPPPAEETPPATTPPEAIAPQSAQSCYRHLLLPLWNKVGYLLTNAHRNNFWSFREVEQVAHFLTVEMRYPGELSRSRAEAAESWMRAQIEGHLFFTGQEWSDLGMVDLTEITETLGEMLTTISTTQSEIITTLSETQNRALTVMNETQQYINFGTESNAAKLLWILGLTAVGVGISVTSIFATLWKRTT